MNPFPGVPPSSTLGRGRGRVSPRRAFRRSEAGVPGRWPSPEPATTRACGSRAGALRLLYPTRTRRVPPCRGAVAFGDAFRAARLVLEPSAFLRVLQRLPSTIASPGACSRGLPLRSDEAASHVARSVLAVPPRLDGLRLPTIRGLVASRRRSWGPPGFRPRPTRARDGRCASPPVLRPPERFPPRQPERRHRPPCPLAVRRARARLDPEALIRRRSSVCATS